MIPLFTGALTEIAVVGAHCDDIAIGMGGTLLTLATDHPGLRVRALVLSGGGTEREAEEIEALAALCPGADVQVTVLDIPDGRAPVHWERIKNRLSEFRRSCKPQVVFGPQRGDAHQDHRLLAELLPTEFRDHLVLGYEILKWEADTPSPTIFHPLESRRGRGEGAPATQALPVADESRLVRRACVSGAFQTSGRAMPQPARRSVRSGKGNRHIRAPRNRRATTRETVKGIGMRLLVTGHQGYLGTVMVPILQAAGHDVTGLDSGFFEDCVLGRRATGSTRHPCGPARCDVRATHRFRCRHPPRRIVQ